MYRTHIVSALSASAQLTRAGSSTLLNALSRESSRNVLEGALFERVSFSLTSVKCLLSYGLLGRPRATLDLKVVTPPGVLVRMLQLECIPRVQSCMFCACVAFAFARRSASPFAVLWSLVNAYRMCNAWPPGGFQSTHVMYVRGANARMMATTWYHPLRNAA